MKVSRVVAVGLLTTAVLLPACASDDGAGTREAGSVVIIGPPPPGGGGSVSAVGTGCTTRGATTKKAGNTVQIELDEYSIAVPATVPTGINRVVVKNFGSDPHEIVITQLDSVDELGASGDVVDIDGLPNKVYRVQSFPGNTICEGTFELPAGEYVVFSNLPADGGSDYSRGMVSTFVVS